MKVIAKMQGTMKVQSATKMTVTSTCTCTYLGICREEEKPFLQDGCSEVGSGKPSSLVSSYFLVLQEIFYAFENLHPFTHSNPISTGVTPPTVGILGE